MKATNHNMTSEIQQEFGNSRAGQNSSETVRKQTNKCCKLRLTGQQTKQTKAAKNKPVD